MHAAYCDRDKIVKFFTHHREFLERRNEQFIKNPQEAIAQMFAFTVDFAITGCVITKVSQISPLAKQGVKLLGKEGQIATTAKTSGIHNPTQAPLTTIATQFVEELKPLAQQGAENLKGALQIGTQKIKHYLNIPEAKNAITKAQKFDVIIKEHIQLQKTPTAGRTSDHYTSNVALKHNEFIEIAEQLIPKTHPGCQVATQWNKPGAPINGWETRTVSHNAATGETQTIVARYRFPTPKAANADNTLIGNIETITEITSPTKKPLFHKGNLHIEIIKE